MRKSLGIYGAPAPTLRLRLRSCTVAATVVACRAAVVEFGFSELAQLVALNFGANDMDGTIIEEHIYKDAGAKKEAMTVPQLMQFIRSAGYTPVERDTVYNELEVFA